MLSNEPVDLTRYRLILVNTSGGKDSALTAWYVTHLAELAGVKDRVHAVHATFPEEWPGTVELVTRQCAALGIPLTVVKRRRKTGQTESLLDYVRRRGMWPSSTERYCTSDFKRAPVDRLITTLTEHMGIRPVRVLNVMGMRADESPGRAKLEPLSRSKRRYNSSVAIDVWLPIFRLRLHQVWALIRQHGLEMHPAYAEGMPRLSCRFCIFAPRDALLKAGELNPELLAEYVEVERTTGHTFRKDLKLAEIQDALARGERATTISDWKM